jgi:hypothetical protein
VNRGPESIPFTSDAILEYPILIPRAALINWLSRGSLSPSRFIESGVKHCIVKMIDCLCCELRNLKGGYEQGTDLGM